MRYSTDHKLQTLARLLDAAGRSFRQHGYGGTGVDGLAKAAGATSGAFYGHFPTKADAFTAAVQVGLEDLRAGVRRHREEHGDGWIDQFASFYMSEEKRCDLATGCALPGLSAEVARADDAAGAAYRAGFDAVVDEVAAGLPGHDRDDRRRRAASFLALLSGGVTIARRVRDPQRADEVAAAVRSSAVALASGVIAPPPAPLLRPGSPPAS